MREIVRINQYAEKIERLAEASGENLNLELTAVKVLLTLLRERTCKWVRQSAKFNIM